MKTFMLTASLFVLARISASAATVILNMSTLPSAQGWTYTASGTQSGQVETNVWSTNGTTLTMNTFGLGLASPGSNLYVRSGLVNAIDPITVEWTSRVLQSEFVANSHYGWSVFAATGAQGVLVGFETNLIRLGAATDIAFNTTAFHDYRIEFTPGAASFDLYVDNVFLASGTPLASVANQIFIGDGSGASNARAEMTSYSFNQAPEPSVAGFLIMSSVAMLARRKRK